jgi:hypothetical protein
MQTIDLKELVKKNGATSEADVREIVEIIQEVERLGVSRTEYNVVPPFSGLRKGRGGANEPGPADPRTFTLRIHR